MRTPTRLLQVASTAPLPIGRAEIAGGRVLHPGGVVLEVGHRLVHRLVIARADVLLARGRQLFEDLAGCGVGIEQSELPAAHHTGRVLLAVDDLGSPTTASAGCLRRSAKTSLAIAVTIAFSSP